MNIVLELRFCSFLDFWFLGFRLNTPTHPLFGDDSLPYHHTKHVKCSNFHILLPHYPPIENENMWRSNWERTLWLGLANDVPALVLQPWAGSSICRCAGEKHQIIARLVKRRKARDPNTGTNPVEKHNTTTIRTYDNTNAIFPPFYNHVEEDFSIFSKRNCDRLEYEPGWLC